MKRIRIEIIFISLFLLFAIYSLIGNIGSFHVNIIIKRLMFFTIQSNLLAVLMLIIQLITCIFLPYKKMRRLKRLLPVMARITILNLLLTAAIYWMVLLPDKFTMGHSISDYSLTNLSVHLVIPVLYLVNYFLFIHKKRQKYSVVFTAFIYPAFYLCLTFIASKARLVFRISRYDHKPVYVPYNFIDLSRLGHQYFYHVAALLGVVLLLSNLLYFIERKTVLPAVQY